MPFINAVAMNGRYRENGDIRFYRQDIVRQSVHVHVDIWGEVSFGDDHHVRLIEHHRIFQRLVLPFRHAHKDNICVCAKRKFGRTDQIPNIFNKNDVRLREIKRVNPDLNLMCIQIVRSAGRNRHDRNAVRPNALRVQPGRHIPL